METGCFMLSYTDDLIIKTKLVCTVVHSGVGTLNPLFFFQQYQFAMSMGENSLVPQEYALNEISDMVI